MTQFPRFWCLVLRAQFQHFPSAFWRSVFAMQLALVSMITTTPNLSLSVFSLQRTRLFCTCGELWRTRGELWLYFEMQRRLDLRSFFFFKRLNLAVRALFLFLFFFFYATRTVIMYSGLQLRYIATPEQRRRYIQIWNASKLPSISLEKKKCPWWQSTVHQIDCTTFRKSKKRQVT